MSDERTGEVREFFRVVRSEFPGPEDFRSMGDEGVDCTRTRHPRECAEGISVWDTVDSAIRQAHSVNFRRGSFIATLRVPTDGGVEFAATFRPHHVTIYYGSPEGILALVKKPAVHIPGTP